MAALSTLALLAGGALAGAVAGHAMSPKAPKQAPAMPTMPAAPDPKVQSQEAEAAAALRRRARAAMSGRAGTMNGTLLTSPQGLGAPASTAPKTLLGL